VERDLVVATLDNVGDLFFLLDHRPPRADDLECYKAGESAER
jgi:hypothetical protein